MVRSLEVLEVNYFWRVGGNEVRKINDEWACIEREEDWKWFIYQYIKVNLGSDDVQIYLYFVGNMEYHALY